MVHHDADLLVLGGGPVGLFAAYCAGFRGMTCVVLDSLPQLGGQITAMYPEKPIFDIAGFPSIKGKELVAGLVAQASRFPNELVLGERAQSLDIREGAGRRFTITTGSGTRIDSSAIVISGGIGHFTPRPLPDAADFMGNGVEHFITDPQEYRGRRVAVVGGGDSAVDWSLLLEPIAESVVLVHRRDAFTAHPYSLELLGRSSVEVVTPAQVSGLGGDARLEWVELTRTGAEPVRRPIDAVVAALGFTANLGPLLDWGIEIESRRYVTVDSTMRSSIDGIYAAGDIAGYPGKVRLISVGFGEAATAVNNAVHVLHPEQDLFPGHSTDQMPSLATAGGVL